MLTVVNFAGVNRGLSTPATAIQPAASQADDVDDCPELFQIRGHLYNLVALRLIEPEDHRFFPQLQNAIARAPEFFHHVPVVLDAAAVAGRPPPNMAEFARRLRQQRLVPVGVQNGDEAWTQAALNAGLNDNQQAPCAKRMGSAGGNGCECSSPGPPATLAQS
jgi:hypothetical protein